MHVDIFLIMLICIYIRHVDFYEFMLVRMGKNTCSCLKNCCTGVGCSQGINMDKCINLDLFVNMFWQVLL